MSELINANPTVLDISQLPTRADANKQPSEKAVEEREAKLVYNSLRKLSLLNVDGYDDDDTVEIEDLSLPDLSEDERSLNVTERRSESEPIDSQEIFDLIAPISDPEHPLTLGQLAVVNLNDIHVTNPTDHNQIGEVLVYITPTITHCSLATLIGLGIRVRLDRCLPKRFRVVILLKKGTHQSENQVNKQLNDKERVSAACENPQLLRVISHMLRTCN